ncbi:MAG TPA: response regulator [Terriglobales bacterium]|nr:response regulator [Terriglobales bacterium]
MATVEILVADDHELFRRTVRAFIESNSEYRICGEAGDGIEAIEKTRQLRPQVVLMDINMPRMDGLEATKIIRRELPECHVIVVTQNDVTIAREQARAVNAHGAVTKSDLTRDLIATIHKSFGNSPAHAIAIEEDVTPAADWAKAGGALGKLVYGFDWTTTPLGALENWPKSLKTIVRVMLASRFAMWMSWGPELTFLYNDAYAKMTLGRKHPWALGKPAAKVWEEIWKDISPRIKKVLQTGQATWDEALLLFLERSGYREETYHTFSYSPLFDDDGNVAGLLCVVTEETDRVISERRLRTLRSLATELGKTITEQDVVATLARILRDNQHDLPFALTYLLSDDRKQADLSCATNLVVGHPAAPASMNVTEDNTEWPISVLLGGKDSVIVEDLASHFVDLPSGGWDKPPTRALLLPIASQTQDKPAGVFIAGLNPYRPLDVSYAGFLNLIAGQIAASIANARAYQEEKKRAEALAEIDQAKTLFFSNVSHEFRTPLTLMLGPLEDLLSETAEIAPQYHDQLDIAHRNSLRLLKLVNTLLDFSRIEAGRFQASYKPTDLSELTSELASVFRAVIERAGLRLIINCPKLDETVYVDRELWEKIVFNLLSNAFKFTFSGEIEISTRKTGASVELVVRDTGTGIPAEDLPHLFERFYRVKNAQGRTFEGSGIGLALVQELAKQHGGSVRVESSIGSGSVFTVSIPRGSDHLPEDRVGAERSLASTSLSGETYVEEALHWLPQSRETSAPALIPPSLPVEPLAAGETRARVLIVDDNADMREYVGKLISPMCEVETAADGEAALKAILERPPDLVLSDVMMPKLDGFGLIKKIRADERVAKLPVILLSARAGEESRVQGISSGADDYLIKPFSARELVARIETQLRLVRVRRESEDQVRQREQELEILRSVGAALASELDLKRIVQAATDAGRELSEASFGAFFYNVTDNNGESYTLYTLSGASPEDFSKFPMPRNTRIFAPTFKGEGTVRIHDVTKDERYGKNEPYYGMPSGHLPVRSYLAVSVLSRSGEVLGGLFYGHPQPGIFTERAERMIEGIAKHAAIAIDNAKLFEALRRSEEQYRTLSAALEAEVTVRTQQLEERNADAVRQSDQVRELSWRLLRSQDEERRHIARELHDSAGQTLAVLGMNVAQMIQKAGRKAPEIAADIEQLQEIVQQLHREIRTTSYLLHPPLLDENGLYSAISWYVAGLSDRSSLKVHLDMPEEFGRLPRDMELMLFRLVQEGLTNIHRHAASDTATIRMARNPENIILEVRDHGKGMPAARLAEIQAGRSGLGIRGMRERLHQFGGTMTVESGSGGTTIAARVPAPTFPTKSEDSTKNASQHGSAPS